MDGNTLQHNSGDFRACIIWELDSFDYYENKKEKEGRKENPTNHVEEAHRIRISASIVVT
jgi:hypothetical protein